MESTVRWTDDVDEDAFVAWCARTRNLPAFEEALRGVPASAWPRVRGRLNEALDRNRYRGGEKLLRFGDVTAGRGVL